MTTLPSLHGKWQMVRAELAGQFADALIVDHTTLEFTAQEYLVRYAETVADRGTYSVESSGERFTLTLQGWEGPNAGRVIPGIFQCVGDRLRICYGLDNVLPTVFATAAGQERYLVTYRRQPV